MRRRCPRTTRSSGLPDARNVTALVMAPQQGWEDSYPGHLHSFEKKAQTLIGPKKQDGGKKSFLWLFNLQVIRNNHSGLGKDRVHGRLLSSIAGCEVSEWNRWEMTVPVGPQGHGPILGLQGRRGLSRRKLKLTTCQTQPTIFLVILQLGLLRAHWPIFCQIPIQPGAGRNSVQTT